MTIYEQRLREWRDPSLWSRENLTPKDIAAMMETTPSAVCGWIDRHKLPATPIRHNGAVTYKIEPGTWLAWANKNRPRILLLASSKPRACPPAGWGNTSPRPHVSPILTITELAKHERTTYSTVWHACKHRGLPYGYLSNPGDWKKPHVVVALADWHWWKSRNMKGPSCRE